MAPLATSELMGTWKEGPGTDTAVSNEPRVGGWMVGCMHAWMHTCLYIYLYIYMHGWVNSWMHAWMPTCKYIYIDIYSPISSVTFGVNVWYGCQYYYCYCHVF